MWKEYQSDCSKLQYIMYILVLTSGSPPPYFLLCVPHLLCCNPNTLHVHASHARNEVKYAVYIWGLVTVDILDHILLLIIPFPSLSPLFWGPSKVLQRGHLSNVVNSIGKLSFDPFLFRVLISLLISMYIYIYIY